MDDLDLIHRNQVAILSGIAALLDENSDKGSRALSDELDRFAKDTSARIAAKLNKTPTIRDADEAAP